MSKGKVLVVDDEPDIIRSIAIRLQSAGYDVLTAMDGLQATNIALKEKPDLIILDIGMPAGDGHVVVERLRGSTRACRIPIIILSARTGYENLQKAIEQGVEKYITKPFKSEELMAAVDEFIGKTSEKQHNQFQ